MGIPATNSCFIRPLGGNGTRCFKLIHDQNELGDPQVAKTLEASMVPGGIQPKPFSPTTPPRLRLARTCYDHMAGTLAVALHDRLLEAGWLRPHRNETDDYDLLADASKVTIASATPAADAGFWPVTSLPLTTTCA